VTLRRVLVELTTTEQQYRAACWKSKPVFRDDQLLTEAARTTTLPIVSRTLRVPKMPSALVTANSIITARSCPGLPFQRVSDR
jgi:hypothetical protein